MLEQEIDRLFMRLNRRVVDPEVACAAIKQLTRAHFRPQLRDAAKELDDFDRFADTLFRRYNSLNTAVIANELKARIRQMRALEEAVEWLNA